MVATVTTVTQTFALVRGIVPGQSAKAWSPGRTVQSPGQRVCGTQMDAYWEMIMA